MIIRVARFDRTYNNKGESEERDYYEVFIDGIKYHEGLELEPCEAVTKAFKQKKERTI